MWLLRKDLKVEDDKLFGFKNKVFLCNKKEITREDIQEVNEHFIDPYLEVVTKENSYMVGILTSNYEEVLSWLTENTDFEVESTIGNRISRFCIKWNILSHK